MIPIAAAALALTTLKSGRRHAGRSTSPHSNRPRPAMGIEDYPDFPRFSVASTGLRDAEERLLQALKSGNKAEISDAKLALTGALDEYSKVVDVIGRNLP